MADATQERPETTTQERWHRIVPTVTTRTSLSRSTIYAAIESGRLRSVKIGGSRRVAESALREFMSSFDGSGEIEAR